MGSSEDVSKLLPSAVFKEQILKLAQAKLSAAGVKKVTVRIYIENSRVFKTVVLTSLMTAEQVVSQVKSETGTDWALFELSNDHGLERPLRDWEVLCCVFMVIRCNSCLSDLDCD